MSLRPLASLLVKMLGLYAIVNALPTISSVLLPLLTRLTPGVTVGSGGVSGLQFSLLSAGGGALQMLFGIALWWFSDGVAHMAVREDGDVPVQKDEGLTAIGFSIVGAYLLAEAAVNVSSLVVYYVVNQSTPAFVDSFGRSRVGDVIILVVRVGIGCYLLLSARGMGRAVARLKDLGRDREEAPSA